jgi:DNA-binding transcriptional ArsR family regulator
VVVHAAHAHWESGVSPQARARRLDDAFGALSDPTRRKVIELLGKAPLRASDLAQAAEASRPGMSRHLRILREAGLVREVEDPEDARARIYCLDPGAFDDVKRWVHRVETFWADQLESFKQLAEQRAAEAPRGGKK